MLANGFYSSTEKELVNLFLLVYILDTKGHWSFEGISPFCSGLNSQKQGYFVYHLWSWIKFPCSNWPYLLLAMKKCLGKYPRRSTSRINILESDFENCSFTRPSPYLCERYPHLMNSNSTFLFPLLTKMTIM